ncbi:MAG: DUF2244 domain-containing protein [Caulobacteraceae bacterium]|nr:DUF2244 domain-containing protein [Caulobacteraceae bacterium]
MTPAIDLDDSPPLLDVSMTSNRSLSRAAGIAVVGGYALVSAVFAVILAAQGFWPVAPFLGLDVAGLALGFWIIGRRRTYEDVTVGASEIIVRRRRPGMRPLERRWPTLWTRLDREDDPDFGCQAVRLSHRGRDMVIGQMLSPIDRSRFAAAMEEAMRRARKGGLAAREPVIFHPEPMR